MSNAQDPRVQHSRPARPTPSPREPRVQPPRVPRSNTASPALSTTESRVPTPLSRVRHLRVAFCRAVAGYAIRGCFSRRRGLAMTRPDPDRTRMDLNPADPPPPGGERYVEQPVVEQQ